MAANVNRFDYDPKFEDGASLWDGSGRTYLSTDAGFGSDYIVETPSGVLYGFLIDANNDPAYIKSTDRGLSWSVPTAFKACTATLISVWPDWWSGITATAYIHVVYTDSGTDDTFYRYLNTADDSLGTERTVYAGSTTAAGGGLSITLSRGGKLMVATCIDAGAEYDTVTSTDLFVNKTSINEVWEGATADQVILFPNPDSADNQDVMAVFWDASADEISLKKYDDSAGTWSESSIATTMVESFPSSSTSWPQFSIAMDRFTNDALLVAWSAVDTLNADLRMWTIDDSAVTEKTNVILNSTDDQGIALISVCSKGYYHAIYGGKTGGAQSFGVTDTNWYNFYEKVSTDNGTTWGSETLVTNTPRGSLCAVILPVCYYGDFYLFHYITDAGWGYHMGVNIPTPARPRASFQLGM